MSLKESVFKGHLQPQGWHKFPKKPSQSQSSPCEISADSGQVCDITKKQKTLDKRQNTPSAEISVKRTQKLVAGLQPRLFSREKV